MLLEKAVVWYGVLTLSEVDLLHLDSVGDITREGALPLEVIAIEEIVTVRGAAQHLQVFHGRWRLGHLSLQRFSEALLQRSQVVVIVWFLLKLKREHSPEALL